MRQVFLGKKRTNLFFNDDLTYQVKKIGWKKEKT